MHFVAWLLLSIVILCFSSFSIAGDWRLSSTENYGNSTLFDDSLPGSGSTFLDEFRWMIESGKLSSARRRALEELQDPSPTAYKKEDIAKIFVEFFQKYYEEDTNEYLMKIQNSVDEKPLRASNDDPNCSRVHSDWTMVDPYELWDNSCSIFPHSANELSLLSAGSQQNSFFESSHQAPCCVFTPGSWTYLRLPAIHEPAVQLGIPQKQYDNNDSMDSFESSCSDFTVNLLNLEQDGYLRPFDVAGILWPTGYMLSLCLGNIVGCPIPELHILIKEYQKFFVLETKSKLDEMHQNHPLLALELGAGIGATSVALATSLKNLGFLSDRTAHPWVVATDLAPHALALTIANSNNNNVGVETTIMDHFEQSSMEEVKRKFFSHKKQNAYLETQNQPNPDGFSLVFGSSLLGFFHDTDRLDSALWKALDELLDSTNPNSLVILAHNRDDSLELPPHPDFRYRLVRRLSGSDDFFGNMINRAGDASELVISVIQRRPGECRNIPIEPTTETED